MDAGVLIGFFAVAAALLAAVGLYGVLASSVRQRTAEIGVRIAIGAEPSGIFRLVVGQGVLLSAVGIAIDPNVPSVRRVRARGAMQFDVTPYRAISFAITAENDAMPALANA